MTRTSDLAKSRPAKEVGAAAAVVGAAALAGKVTRDRRADAERAAQRAFRLYPGEPVPGGIRRVARGQLDEAHARLSGSRKRALEGAVHDTRKAFKRLRATVRLAREALGDEIYRQENAALRESGRRLSGVRDASVLVQTLDELEECSGDDLPRGKTGQLRQRLEEERRRALKSLRGEDAAVAAVVADIGQARIRTAGWTFEIEGFEALEPGMRRIYRRGRQAMRRASADTTNENLHEWRKRVKDLWHSEQLMRPAAPKKMKKLAKRTHALSGLLGDDHDLAELRLYVERHPEAFDDRAGQQALVAVIDRRRSALQRAAFALGDKLYRRSPKRFVAVVRRRWDKRARPATAVA